MPITDKKWFKKTLNMAKATNTDPERLKARSKSNVSKTRPTTGTVEKIIHKAIGLLATFLTIQGSFIEELLKILTLYT